MSDQYVGEIRMFAGTYAPEGWHLCDGTLLPVSAYETLFALIGTTYGGDGVTNFGLPDLRSRIPIGQGQGSGLSNYVLGSAAGTEDVILTENQIPSHTHQAQAYNGPGTQPSPENALWADPSQTNQYYSNAGFTPDKTMDPNAITITGGSLPHYNVMPFLCINFIIALTGLFPSSTQE